MSDVASLGFRAGFWRRLFSFITDILIVGLCFQMLAVWLYSASGGKVQGTGFVRECHSLQKIDEEGLRPPPPRQSNFATACKSSLFGFVTSRFIIVGRSATEGRTKTVVSQTYHLGNDDKPLDVLDLDWVFQLALLAYLVVLEHRRGATLGERILGLEVVSWKTPGSPGIPFASAIIRQLAKCIGAVPLLVLVLYHYLVDGLETLFNVGFFSWTIARSPPLPGAWGICCLSLPSAIPSTTG